MRVQSWVVIGGSGAAVAGLGLGSVLLYMVWVHVVPSPGRSWHFVIYNPHVYLQYTFLSNMLLWGMSRRARVARLQYELTYGRHSRASDERARNRRNDSSDDEYDIEHDAAMVPLPPLPSEEEAEAATRISSIVEGVEMSGEELEAAGQLWTQSNPVCGVVVPQTAVDQVAEKADQIPSMSTIEPLGIVHPASVLLDDVTTAGAADVRGGALLEELSAEDVASRGVNAETDQTEQRRQRQPEEEVVVMVVEPAQDPSPSRAVTQAAVEDSDV